MPPHSALVKAPPAILAPHLRGHLTIGTISKEDDQVGKVPRSHFMREPVEGIRKVTPRGGDFRGSDVHLKPVGPSCPEQVLNAGLEQL